MKPLNIVVMTQMVVEGKPRVHPCWIAHDLRKVEVVLDKFVAKQWALITDWATCAASIACAPYNLRTPDVDWLILDGRNAKGDTDHMLDSLPADFVGKVIVVADGPYEHSRANFVVDRTPLTCCPIAEVIRADSA